MTVPLTVAAWGLLAWVAITAVGGWARTPGGGGPEHVLGSSQEWEDSP